MKRDSFANLPIGVTKAITKRSKKRPLISKKKHAREKKKREAKGTWKQIKEEKQNEEKCVFVNLNFGGSPCATKRSQSEVRRVR